MRCYDSHSRVIRLLLHFRETSVSPVARRLPLSERLRSRDRFVKSSLDPGTSRRPRLWGAANEATSRLNCPKRGSLL